MLAIDPPLVRMPLPSDGMPKASRIQPVTCSSKVRSISSKAADTVLVLAFTSSASTPPAVPDPGTHPQNRGWMLPRL